MKYRLPFALLALCLVFFWGTSTATVRVTDISLQKNSQFTEVTLTCDGAAEFTHQIVEATANKPYRIVIDVKDAVPGLDRLSYKNLPSGSIKQIRTSQYTTDPEKVVRVVLDVAGTLTYKVKGNGNTFTLQIDTPADKDFPRWSAAGGSAATALAETNAQTSAKSETTKKSESQPTTPTVAKSDAPKSMPAHPEKPVAPPQATSGENGNKDAKLAAKPIDESKLLTKVNKPTPVAKEEEKSSQEVTSTATATKKDTKPSTKQSVTPAATTPTTTEASAGKRADSATLQQMKPAPSQPAATPVEQAKPPKAQKTSLPETKVSKSPPYTQAPEAGNALTGEIATAAAGTKPAATAVKTEGAKDSSQSSGLSKSEEVRQRYLAGRDKGTTPAEAAAEGMEAADTTMSQMPLTEIEKIRLKYKRGIRFVQNDRDEQQQAASEPEEYEEGEQQQSGVGAYNEFLPEREIVVYQSSGHADPFLPLIEEATASAKGGELPDVETLRLVGILQDKKVSRALFEDYNGYSYILRTGDRVKNGFVLAIEDTRVLFQIRQYGWNRQVAIDLENER